MNDFEVQICPRTDYVNTTPAFETFLYHTSRHLTTQTTDIVYSFYLRRRTSKLIVAVFHCVKKSENVWESPPNAPFGGICCDSSCQKTELIYFLEVIKTWVGDRGGKKIIIKTAPACYEPILHALLYDAYLDAEFIVSKACTNHSIDVGPDKFSSQIRPAERRKLNKSALAGFTVQADRNLSPEVVYAFLKECRDQKGYAMSLTLSQLKDLLKGFPGAYRVFTVTDHTKIVALTLTVRVSPDILYNFLCDSLAEYRVFSPVVLLMEGVYNHCQHEKIRILDLGISLDHNGNHKPSLSRFKRNIGGRESLKLTFEVDLPGQISRQFPSL